MKTSKSIQGKHRKRVKHYHEPGHCHELTFSCYRRMSLLTSDLWRRMLSVAINRAAEKHGFGLAAWVYMPEHVHLVVHPVNQDATIEGLLRAIKRPFSYRIKQILEAQESPLLDKLTIVQRPGVTTFRFWQEGPGYDRNLTTPKATLAAIDYLHKNPVRRGLCPEAVQWRWSSARHYIQIPRPVDPDSPTVHDLPAGWLDQITG